MVLWGRENHKEYTGECKCFPSVLNVQRKMKVIPLVENEWGERTRNVPHQKGEIRSQWKRPERFLFLPISLSVGEYSKGRGLNGREPSELVYFLHWLVIIRRVTRVKQERVDNDHFGESVGVKEGHLGTDSDEQIQCFMTWATGEAGIRLWWHRCLIVSLTFSCLPPTVFTLTHPHCLC